MLELTQPTCLSSTEPPQSRRRPTQTAPWKGYWSPLRRHPPFFLLRPTKWVIPSGYVNSLLLKMAIEIVSFPTKNDDFP